MDGAYMGWKEIVPYVGMGGQRTLRRFAREFGFPLRRAGRRVYVIEAEVELWLRTRPNATPCQGLSGGDQAERGD